MAIRGRPTAGCQLQRVWPFRAGWLCCCLRRCLMLSGQGVVAHSWLPLPVGRTGGPYNTSYAAAVAATFLDVLSSLLLVETGARTPSCVLRRRPPTGAEVVAVAGEAAPCKGGCLLW